MVCDAGRAVVDLDGLVAKKEFCGPILGRRRDIPLYAVATTVMKRAPGDWISWYNRGIAWSQHNGAWVPKYGIHFAESQDGLDWQCESDLIIPFKDEYEHSFGRPSVILLDGCYLMWFAARGSNKDPLYRIGFAISRDGRSWSRNDSVAGVEPEGTGWESDAVCYPYVFIKDQIVYMLYNGNEYGRTGFGYATTTINELQKAIAKHSKNI